LAALASALLICATSVASGQAALAACGWRRFTWLAAPVGLAILMIVSGVAVHLPGHGSAVAVALCVILAASVATLVRRPPAGFRATMWPALAAGVLAAALAATPFIAAGRVGILGVGLVNDDMASHLLIADWLGTRFHPEPVLIGQGYPLGPHALMAGLASLTGAELIDAFAGLVLAIPALTALVAFEALRGLRPVARIGAAALVALPYMAAAYLAQEAFKEPIVALFVLGFALLLPAARDWRTAIPLGMIAAGAVYVYSFPGLFWLAGIALISFLWRPMPRLSGAALAGLAVVLVVLIAPDLGRIVDFTHFRAFDVNRANEGGVGNLHGYLSPLEALGVWPTSEFRLSAGAGSLPAAAFYLGALLGAAALALGLVRWVRAHGWTVPAALATAVVIYAGARAFGTVYTSGKALAIVAPIVMLIALGGLLGDPARGRRLGLALAGVFAVVAIASSFLVLRQAPVGPQAHMDELAQIRPLVESRKLLFLGRDNFVLYELRGARPFTHVRNFYDPFFVKPNFDLKDVASKFDFDSVTARKLARFPYVLTTRAGYASGPPPSYRPVAQTDSYVLWQKHGSARRLPLERGPEPGREIRCGTHGAPRTAVFDRPPVGPVLAWSPSGTVESGDSASLTLELPRGRWNLSLQYDATRPVTLTGPSFRATLPGNLDYRGVTPYWPAGTIDSRRGGTLITATVEEPTLAGRLLGAHSVAHLGGLAATRAGPGYARAAAPTPGEGERIVRGPGACGRYGDWQAAARR
jgi:hypothetical protein